MCIPSLYTTLTIKYSVHEAQSCQDGSVRLTGGPNVFEGRVEICVDGSWGQVCAMGWASGDARVVCRQLGHSTDRCKLLITLSTCTIHSDYLKTLHKQQKLSERTFMAVNLHQLVFLVFCVEVMRIDWWTAKVSPSMVLPVVALSRGP